MYIYVYIYRSTLYCQGQPHDGRAAYASVAMLDLHAQRGARAACMVLMMRVEAVGSGHKRCIPTSKRSRPIPTATCWL